MVSKQDTLQEVQASAVSPSHYVCVRVCVRVLSFKSTHTPLILPFSWVTDNILWWLILCVNLIGPWGFPDIWSHSGYFCEGVFG